MIHWALILVDNTLKEFYPHALISQMAFAKELGPPVTESDQQLAWFPLLWLILLSKHSIWEAYQIDSKLWVALLYKLKMMSKYQVVKQQWIIFQETAAWSKDPD